MPARFFDTPGVLFIGLNRQCRPGGRLNCGPASEISRNRPHSAVCHCNYGAHFPCAANFFGYLDPTERETLPCLPRAWSPGKLQRADEALFLDRLLASASSSVMPRDRCDWEARGADKKGPAPSREPALEV
jgi:hypothetical protein